MADFYSNPPYSVDALVAGAKNSKNDMMKPIQADEAKLKAAAAEIVK